MSKKEYRPLENQNLWNMLASAFFIVVLVGALYIINRVRGSLPTSIPLFDALVLAFAAFRITRLVVYDKITRFFREWFVDKREEEIDGVRMVALMPVMQGIRGTIHDLLGCPWCIGIWAALVVVFCYYVFSWGWLVLFMLAVAGVGSFIQLTANMIGWKAENLKLDARGKE